MNRAAFQAVRTNVVITGTMAAVKMQADTARGGLGDVAENKSDGREAGTYDSQADLAGLLETFDCMEIKQRIEADHRRVIQ